MTKKLKVYCPYSALDLEWETLKNLQNITFEKPWYLGRNNNESIYRYKPKQEVGRDTAD